jgi:hypothetical protein
MPLTANNQTFFMTVRTFWIILLKISGLWLGANGLYYFFEFYLSGYLLTLEQTMFLSMTRLIFGILIFVVLPIGLIFQPQWFIEVLRLDKENKGQQLSLDENRGGFLSVAVIVIGGLMIIQSLPAILSLLHSMYYRDVPGFADFAGENLTFHICKSILGYLLITNANQVVQFIEKRSKPEATDNDNTRV